MFNWMNLLMSLLLFCLLGCCFIEIGVLHYSVGGGRGGPPQDLLFIYEFYNQSMVTLGSTISVGCLGIFYLIRFISKQPASLTWKVLGSFLPFMLVFFWTTFENYKTDLFEFRWSYFVAIGITILFLLLSIWMKMKRNSIRSFSDVLDEPTLT